MLPVLDPTLIQQARPDRLRHRPTLFLALPLPEDQHVSRCDPSDKFTLAWAILKSKHDLVWSVHGLIPAHQNPPAVWLVVLDLWRCAEKLYGKPAQLLKAGKVAHCVLVVIENGNFYE